MRHATFAISEWNPAYPVHTQTIFEDDDDGALVQPDHAVVSDDKDDQPLVRPAQEGNLLRRGVIKPLITETLNRWFLRDLLHDNPLVRPDRTTVSEEEGEDDKPLVQPASALKRESSAIRRVPHHYEGEVDRQSGKTELPHWNKKWQGTRASGQRMSRVWAKIQMVKLSKT